MKKTIEAVICGNMWAHSECCMDKQNQAQESSAQNGSICPVCSHGCIDERAAWTGRSLKLDLACCDELLLTTDTGKLCQCCWVRPKRAGVCCSPVPAPAPGLPLPESHLTCLGWWCTSSVLIQITGQAQHSQPVQAPPTDAPSPHATLLGAVPSVEQVLPLKHHG